MTAGGRFQVRVEGVRFDAAHFATFGGKCEALHGHSYEVAAEIDGPLSENSWVVDFIALKAMLRGFCDELDHRFMLQTESRILKMAQNSGCWEVSTPKGNRYTLPAADVAPLPIDNTTAERLAEWLCERLTRALAEKGLSNLEGATVEVWEGPGQRASFSRLRGAEKL